MTTYDNRGRKYIEVRPFETDGAIQHALERRPEACVECQAPIVHGRARYFQRHDPPAPRNPRAHPETARPSALLTFDNVCGTCGDKALAGYPARLAFDLAGPRRARVLAAADALHLTVAHMHGGDAFVVVVPDPRTAYELGVLCADG